MSTFIRGIVAALALGVATGAVSKELSAGEERFLKQAAADGLAEVQLGRLAQDKALREEVKQFAAQMVADHGKANEELMGIAASRRVKLPTEPDGKQRRSLERLGKLLGPDFDRAYMKMMVDDHRKDVKEFERQAKSARDPEVRDFAARTLATLRGHMDAARATYDTTLGSKRTGERETGSKKP